MALKLFRRKSKAPVVKEPEKEVKKIVEVRFLYKLQSLRLWSIFWLWTNCRKHKIHNLTVSLHLIYIPFSQDVLPEDSVKVERVAMAPVDKQETIEEEGDVSTVESAADEPVSEEVEPIAETTETEQTKEQSSPFACCQGSPADVMKNLQAAVGMA